MSIDLQPLLSQIADHETLWQSRDALLNGLLDLLDNHHASDIAEALRALTPHPGDPNRKVAWVVLLGEALTRNTSHVAVDPRHPGYATAHRMLTETPELDKAAHIADLETRLAAKTIEHETALAEVSQLKAERSAKARADLQALARSGQPE